MSENELAKKIEKIVLGIRKDEREKTLNECLCIIREYIQKDDSENDRILYEIINKIRKKRFVKEEVSFVKIAEEIRDIFNDLEDANYGSEAEMAYQLYTLLDTIHEENMSETTALRLILNLLTQKNFWFND